jgi:hypothetical protein
MLSLQKCRELLGPSEHLSDSELSQLVNSFYILAEVAVRMHADAVRASSRSSQAGGEDADVEERAAIMEFDGKMPRLVAEGLAGLAAPRKRTRRRAVN